MLIKIKNIMNYSLQHANPRDIIKWINEAIKQKAEFVAIVMDENSHDEDEPRYLSKIHTESIEKRLIKLINADDERYSLKFVIDVEAEIQKNIHEGVGGIDYQEAKKVFPGLEI